MQSAYILRLLPAAVLVNQINGSESDILMVGRGGNDDSVERP